MLSLAIVYGYVANVTSLIATLTVM
jgi:hypothetical protein